MYSTFASTCSTLRPGQNNCHLADIISMFLNENCCIFNQYPLKFVPKGAIENKSALLHAEKVTGHYLNQSWLTSLTSMMPPGIIGPQRVKQNMIPIATEVKWNLIQTLNWQTAMTITKQPSKNSLFICLWALCHKRRQNCFHNPGLENTYTHLHSTLLIVLSFQTYTKLDSLQLQGRFYVCAQPMRDGVTL